MINKCRILNGAKYFSSGTLQNYLVFISADKYIEFFIGVQKYFSWKSKGMSEDIKNSLGSDHNFAPILINSYPIPVAKLINNNISPFRKVINIYISYTLDTWSKDLTTLHIN